MNLALNNEATTGECAACGIPLDSQYFDDSHIRRAPEPGEEVLLARFDLPPQYCGVLQNFSQYTDLLGGEDSLVETPDLEWRILVNSHPLFPYFGFRHIVNPWGYGGFPVNIRLDDSATLEFVVRRLNSTPEFGPNEEPPAVTRVGGRIMGRFWYNAAYGDVIGR